MNESPKKIWIYGKQWQEAPEFYPMTFESDKPMVSKESYIRADIVDELVAALKYCMRYNGYDFDETPAEAALKKLEDV